MYRSQDGSIKGVNIGKFRANGTMIQREVDAISDLEGAGVPMHFVPYNW